MSLKKEKIKVLIATNIPSPYRVDFFNFIQKEYSSFEFYFLFTSINEDNREWKVNLNKITNTIVLKSHIFRYKKNNDKKYVHFPKRLFNQLRNVNPDIIVSSEYNIASLSLLLWAKVHNKKFINWTDGTLNSEKDINFIQKLSRKVIISFSNAFIASSSKAKEKLLSYDVNDNNIFVSYLTEDLEEFYKYKSDVIIHNGDTKVLLYVGQVIERKGLDLLLKALSLVKVKYVLNIVGNGDNKYLNDLNNLINELKLDNNVVIFKGFKEGIELIKEYNNCDIFVFPTRCDCYGLVMLEAWAMGKYQIVSKFADGAYDIIDDNNGIIVNPYETEKFGRIIDEKLKDFENINVNKEKIIKFNFENTAKQFISAINSVMQ